MRRHPGGAADANGLFHFLWAVTATRAGWPTTVHVLGTAVQRSSSGSSSSAGILGVHAFLQVHVVASDSEERYFHPLHNDLVNYS